jgi:hypothetical protein
MVQNSTQALRSKNLEQGNLLSPITPKNHFLPPSLAGAQLNYFGFRRRFRFHNSRKLHKRFRSQTIISS